MARLSILVAISSLALLVNAQFGGNIFEQFFQGQGGGHPGHPGHQQQPKENAPSNSEHYQLEFDNVYCDKYLCPGTLACVHFPHHCPCAFPSVEDKVELGDGIAICASKMGFHAEEMQQKVDLARKGLL